MENGWGFLATVVASSTGSAALLAIAAYFGRSQISHWLSKDLERLKSQYARELEAYKVSLIAETEKIKATQEVKKQAALLHLQQKYAALMALQSATAGLVIDLAAKASATPHHKNSEDTGAYLDRISRAYAAVTGAHMYLTPEERAVCADYQMSLSGYLDHIAVNAPAFELNSEGPHFQLAIDRANKLNDLIARKVSELSE